MPPPLEFISKHSKSGNVPVNLHSQNSNILKDIENEEEDEEDFESELKQLKPITLVHNKSNPVLPK